MSALPTWITRARRHAEVARELDEIAEALDRADLDIWLDMFGSRVAVGAPRRLRALAEAERQERDRLMQLRERA